jgi:hypothetical protein
LNWDKRRGDETMSKKAMTSQSLTDDYIRRLLMQSRISKALGLKKEDITPEMMELKRQD